MIITLRFAAHEDAYKAFFIIKETPVRGRYVLLTNDIKDPVEALVVYRNKDAVA